MTTPHCTTCGTEIPEGQGRYVTHDGIYCCQCGLPFPLTRDVKVTITITGLDKQGLSHGAESKDEGGT